MERLELIPKEKIDRAILFIRGEKVMLDIDLAEVYGVKTKRLNEQVKRNSARFPADFMFQLTNDEKAEVVANCDHLLKIKYSSTNPFAFTEHGAIMLASILNTPKAIQSSVLIVRAFVNLREILTNHREFANKINEMEAKYDHQFASIFQALRALMQEKEVNSERRIIGFKIRQDDNITTEQWLNPDPG